VDLIIVADKVKGGRWEYAEEILKTIPSLGYRFASASLILYHEWSTPLVEPTPSLSAPAEAYSQVTPLPGRPEPSLGLREAYHMILDYWGDLARPKVLLLWSAAARPRIRLELGLRLLESVGVGVDVVVLRPSLPGWARYVGVPERHYTYRSTSSPLRLLMRVAG
jgi:hypothetical protein